MIKLNKWSFQLKIKNNPIALFFDYIFIIIYVFYFYYLWYIKLAVLLELLLLLSIFTALFILSIDILLQSKIYQLNMDQILGLLLQELAMELVMDFANN